MSYLALNIPCKDRIKWYRSRDPTPATPGTLVIRFLNNKYYENHLKIEVFLDDVITGQGDVIVTLSFFGTQDRLFNLKYKNIFGFWATSCLLKILLGTRLIDINPCKTHKLTNIHHFDLVLDWEDYARAMEKSDLTTPLGFISFNKVAFLII